MSAEWKVAVGDQTTTAVFDPATTDEQDGPLFVMAHGAGGNMSDRGMLALAKVLRARGLNIVRFNFLYKEKGSGRPDPMPRLMETTAAVVDRARQELAPQVLLTGGRSMGGRAASMLAADGFRSDGLMLYAYPLHPDGNREKLRDAHLPSIKVPVIQFNGTRDGLCHRDLMETALKTVTTDWTMHWIEGADHSFHVLKSSGRNDGMVLAEIADATLAWVSARAKKA